MGYPRLRDCLSSPSARDGILCGPVGFFVTTVGIEDFRGGVPGSFVVAVVTGIFIIAIMRLDSLWSPPASSSSPSASRNLGAMSSDCLSEASRDNKESRLGDDEDKDSYNGGDKKSRDTALKILNADDGDTEADEDHKESCLGDADDKDSRHGGGDEQPGDLNLSFTFITDSDLSFWIKEPLIFL